MANNIDGLLKAAQLQVPNLKDTAARIRSKTSLGQADISALADCLIKAENAVATIKTILAGFDTPTWLPYVRIGYPESDPPIVADDSGVRIRGDALITGTVEASAFNISQPVVVDLTLTNNSPTAGKVAWSACTVVYQGVKYSITGNNTIESLIWWVTGASTFTAGASFTPASNIFLIATNTGGTADTAWNKVANQGVQRENFMGAFLEGFIPLALEEVTVDLAGTSTTLVNHSGGAGILLSLSGYVKTATGASPYLTITVTDVDGVVGAYTLKPYENSTIFTRKVHMQKQHGSGDGSNVGDYFSIYIGLSYLDSIQIDVNTFPDTGTGEIYIAAWRANKV